jgi:hypothetical protein
VDRQPKSDSVPLQIRFLDLRNRSSSSTTVLTIVAIPWYTFSRLG